MNKITRNVWSALKAKIIIAVSVALGLGGQSFAGLNDWAPLSIQDQAQTGFNFVGIFDATNFLNAVTNANASANNTLFPRPLVATVNFPAGTRIRNVAIKVVTAVATSGGATSVALNVGDAVLTNRYLSAIAVGTNIGTGALQTNNGLAGYNAGSAGTGTWYVGGNTNHVYNFATNISIWTLPVADVNANITSGRYEIYLNAYNLNDAKGL